MPTIGKRLKRMRMEHGLNQKAVADIAGVTNAAISKWESQGGESMSAVVAIRLARRLKVNPFWLVLGEGAATDKLHMPEISDYAQEFARKVNRLPEHLSEAISKVLFAISHPA